MDLQDWELLPDDGYLEIHDDGGKKIFSRKFGSHDPNKAFRKNYFTIDSPLAKPRPPNQIVPVPIELNPSIDRQSTKQIDPIPIQITEIKDPNKGDSEPDQDPFQQVFFTKSKEPEFVDMKVESPRANSRGIVPQIDLGFQFEGKKCEEEMGDVEEGDEDGGWRESNNGGLNLWKWSLNGIGAICSFAAAAICIVAVGAHQRNKHHHQRYQKIGFQIYSDDKRMKQVVHHASKLNEAIVRGGGPLSRAHITVGGYHDGLWSNA